ncbi:MAG TPA: HEAT repeat domain-containing protein [Phycisphaerae bacterium]|nr:HEAT repeat domain-containing protein [Phycisphaerae bacterium]HPS53263.1 HEAT repeat domain-containing protein [Phycisphaerae bacterium]
MLPKKVLIALCVLFMVTLVFYGSAICQADTSDNSASLENILLAAKDKGGDEFSEFEDLEEKGEKSTEKTDETAVEKTETVVEVKETELDKQWQDMLYYITVARPEYAKAYANAILKNADASPKNIYMLSVKYSDSIKTLQLGEGLGSMKELVEKLLKTIETGYGDWRTNAEQIEESISKLQGTQRAFKIATARLAESGEYAVPLLIVKLQSSETSKLVIERIIAILPQMGKSAVRPLSAALQSNDLKLVEIIADALGQMQYPAALPRLCEAYARNDVKENKNVLRAVKGAILACSGGDSSLLDMNPGRVFLKVADMYYSKSSSLLPDSKKDAALVWSMKKQGTAEALTAEPVPAVIFCDVYAMRYARLALKYDRTLSQAIPLWLSAAIRRQLELPAGAKDPLWAQNAPKAEFYALASSPRYLQDVLAKALDDNNTGIAKVVISAMNRNTGTDSLIMPVAGGKMPLVAAMNSDDKDVRYLAAETLALAQPKKSFTGQSSVVEILKEALKEKGEWSIRAAAAFQAIGGGTTCFDLTGCVESLKAALAGGSAELQKAIVNALAVMNDSQAQQTIVDFALTGKTEEESRIAAFNAATRSVRAFGNQTSSQQAKNLAAMLIMVEGSQNLRQSAAQLLGALNLKSSQMSNLILSTEKLD